jgi:5-methylthioadenosine/S-adenosylhomocysteine deaminase
MKKKFNIPFVNCHTHVSMIAFRGLAEDMTLHKWLNDYIWPSEAKNVNEKFVYKNSNIAIKEMRKNHISVFADMYFFEDQTARVCEKLKMHAVLGEGILDFKTPSANTSEDALKITENLLEKYKNNKYIKIAVCPHSIYTVSKKVLIKAKELAKKYNAIYHIHLSETKKEFDDCKNQNNCTPVEYLNNLNILDDMTLLAHCVYLTDNDIKILAEKNVNVCHCPLSNLKLGSGIAQVSKMINAGINVCLGTDGPASSNRLDILEAGKFAGLLQRGITGDASILPGKKILEMMSVNGLKALHINEINGKTINQIQKQIDEISDYSFIYNLNINEL